MDIFEEFFKIIRGLNRSRAKYAVIGGIAMAFYDKPRFTKDIDILTLESEVEKVTRILTELGYDETAPKWIFRSSKMGLWRFAKIEGSDVMPIDILFGSESFHAEIVSHATKQESKGGMVRVASKADLIKLKSLRNSDQDKVDIKVLKGAKQ